MKSRVLSLVTVVALMTALLFVPQSMAMADDYALNEYEAAYLSLIDYDHAEALGEYLTTEIGNRFAFSPRRDMCADWLMDEFASYGYEPYIHEFAHTTSYNNGIIEIGDNNYAYYGPAYGTTSVYKYNSRDMLSITGAEVVNWAAPGSALTVPEGAAYGGKAVFVVNGGSSAPSAANYYNAALALQNAGAGAVLFQTFQEASNGNTSYSRIGNTTSGTEITIPVGYVLNYETRGIAPDLSATTGIKLNMYASNIGKNVVAVLPSAIGSDKTVYFTTHYDTTGSGPGMNDNGSGTLFTLEMARALQGLQFEYNIAFIAFDSEENGLVGARAFCANMTDAERAGFVANYNVDMICTSQADCIHMFLNISDTRLRTLEGTIGNNQRLMDLPAAVEIAKEYEVFNHSYLAGLKTGFDMTKFNICYDTTTDHYAFVQEATRAGNNFPNMRNAVEYDWRRNEKGTSFETLYHKVGDTYAMNFSRERLEEIGDLIALATYYSAKSLDGKTVGYLDADAASGIEGDVEYTLSLSGAKDVLALELEFVIDGPIAGKDVVGANGFEPMSDIFWTAASGGAWKGALTLKYEAGGSSGFTAPVGGSLDVAAFVFNPTAEGDATMALTGFKVVGLDGGTTKYIDSIVAKGEAVTSVEQTIYSKYDLNRDNTVDALDLGIMLLYCGFKAEDPEWDALIKVNDSKGKPVTANMCDVNGDGFINMLDLIDLFINYTK